MLVLSMTACAVVALAAPLRRTAWLAAGAGAAVVGLVATLPLYDVPLAAVVGLLVALGAAALLLRERLPDHTALAARGGRRRPARRRDRRGPAQRRADRRGAGRRLDRRAALLVRRTDLTGDVAAAVLPLALAGLVWSAAEVAGAPEVYRGVPILLLVGGLALGRPAGGARGGCCRGRSGRVCRGRSIGRRRTASGAGDLPHRRRRAGDRLRPGAPLPPLPRLAGRLPARGRHVGAARPARRARAGGLHAADRAGPDRRRHLAACGSDDRVSSLAVLAPGLALATVPSLLVSLDDPASLRARCCSVPHAWPGAGRRGAAVGRAAGGRVGRRRRARAARARAVRRGRADLAA